MSELRGQIVLLKDTTLGARGYRITIIWANSADDKKKKKKKKKIVIFFLLPRKQDLTFMQWRQFA